MKHFNKEKNVLIYKAREINSNILYDIAITILNKNEKICNFCCSKIKHDIEIGINLSNDKYYFDMNVGNFSIIGYFEYFLNFKQGYTKKNNGIITLTITRTGWSEKKYIFKFEEKIFEYVFIKKVKEILTEKGINFKNILKK
jgi:hypothetical protein